MKIFKLLIPSLFFFFQFLAFSQKPDLVIEKVATTYDLVIEKAKIVDGTGEEAFWGQVLILDGTIHAIEKDTSIVHEAKKRINANGRIVSPGFIDTHAHGDPLETPGFRNFLAMGVTSISLGQDGSSPEVADLRNWMKKVDEVRPAVNIAMFAGHNTLRKLSGINFDSLPKQENMEKMQLLLEKAMDAGCFGMTTGLEYIPGFYAKSEELQELAKIVGKKNGLLMSHMRDEDDDQVEASIKELLAQGKFTPVHISHLKVVYGKGEKRAEEILQLLDDARKNGSRITADIYPYNASYTGIGILFPSWAKEPNDYEEVVETRRDELSRHLRELVIKRNGPEATLIGSGPFSGKTLTEIASEMKKPFEEVLIDDIGPYGAGAAYFVMDKKLQEQLMTHHAVNICTDGSPEMRHPRGYGSFSKVIETYVVNEKLLSLEEAVYKMSGLPAKTLKLKDRGFLQPGLKADIIIFDPARVRENATYEDPHQLAEGMDYVIVNGKTAKESEVYSETGKGMMLRKK